MMFLTFGMWLFSAVAHANEEFEASMAEWKAIGINSQTNMVAFKVIYTPNERDDGADQNCSYPGVEKNQFVQLGAWDVGTQKIVQTWDVYPLKNEKGECASEETSKATLQQAKDFFTSQNIDISATPKPLSIQQDNTFLIPKKDKTTAKFLVMPGAERSLDADGFESVYEQDIKNEKGVVVYHLEKKRDQSIGGWMTVSYDRAYMIGDKVVFVEGVVLEGMFGKIISHSLTPMIDVE